MRPGSRVGVAASGAGHDPAQGRPARRGEDAARGAGHGGRSLCDGPRGDRGGRGGWHRRSRPGHMAGFRREQACPRQRRRDRLHAVVLFRRASFLCHAPGQFRRDEHRSGSCPPELAASAGDRSQRLRHRGPAHGGWCHRARDRLAGRRHRHHLRCVLRSSFGLCRRRCGRGHDAYRRHGSFGADLVPPYRHRGDSSHFVLVDRVHRRPRRLARAGARSIRGETLTLRPGSTCRRSGRWAAAGAGSWRAT